MLRVNSAHKASAYAVSLKKKNSVYRAGEWVSHGGNRNSMRSERINSTGGERVHAGRRMIPPPVHYSSLSECNTAPCTFWADLCFYFMLCHQLNLTSCYMYKCSKKKIGTHTPIMDWKWKTVLTSSVTLLQEVFGAKWLCHDSIACEITS